MNAPLILTADAKTEAASNYMAEKAVASGFVLGGTGALADESVVDVFALESAEDIKLYGEAVAVVADEVVDNGINFVMDVKVSVEANTLTWEVTELTKDKDCVKIATIDIPQLNLLSVDAAEEDSVFAGAQASTTTTNKADTYITFDEGFVPSSEDGYLYAFLTNGKLSAGIHSNSEKEGDKRVERINTADTMSLTSAVWYYESGDAATGQAQANVYDYQASELPQAKVAIADGDLNGDGDIDWNDGAIAFRDVMHYAQGTEVIKDTVNYRIVMNFESAAPNPFLVTADNVKKVYLATDGLPQALLLKGYGNEGHDSANSEYADIAEREGGVEDFQNLIKIAHDYNTEIGIHVNAQEAYPEARSFNEAMISTSYGTLNGNGWGWLDQSVVINKLWDLASDARLKRFVQLYDRINETDFYSGDWEEKEYVKDSQGDLTNGDGVTAVSRTEALELIKADAATREDNMDFIYLDVWYQDAWETRRIAEEINSLGWRFSTEFSAEGEYDSTWQHWSTDTTYGGAGAKGLNSDIIRFLRNDQRDSQVLNWPSFGGTADNPLLGGFRLYGFEGWGGQQDFENYIYGTFTENVPTKFLQHYEVIDWENYGDDGSEEESPVGNTEKQITLTNDEGDVVVVTRNEEQRSDIEIERTITLNGKVVLNTDADEHVYLLPWIDNQNGEEKLYHWNLDGGTTTWDLQDDWAALENVVVYELSDQGRSNETEVAVVDGTVTLEAKASTAYVVVKGAELKELVADFGEYENVVDPGFNGYADGAKLDAADWSGDIDAEGVAIKRSNYGDQRLAMTNTADEVSVTTTISGLTAGEDYVAEIYLSNESDAKATMTVDAGENEVSAYTYRSIATNYISCDSEHGTSMNRMQVSFVAEGETAEFTLTREAGAGYTHWDDIRIVEQKVDNWKEDGSFEQDFESVVQGLYPFILGYNAGGDSRTHLSQLNAPYTQKGWNGKSVDDVLGGEWSLKHHTNITGLAYRTIPQNFRFEAGKVYTVEFDYQTASAGYQMIVGDGKGYTVPTEYLPVATETAHAEMQVVGSGSGQTWIGLYMNGSMCYSDTAIGNVDFILDNLVIKEQSEAVAVTVEKTDLYLGETSSIFGAGLDKVTWSTSEEGIVTVDKENNKINAIGAGEVTLTASYGEGETEEFVITVTDVVAKDLDRTEFAGITMTANTEEPVGEGAGNGVASAAVDGDSSTFWHTVWYGDSFAVSASNPAILTVDLGETLAIGGFKIQNRSNRSDRGIVTFSYEVMDADGQVILTGEDITVDSVSQQSGAWITEVFDNTVDAKSIVITVTQANSEDGSMAVAEIEPIAVDKVATEADLADAEVAVGEKATLNAVPVDGNMLKGLVWTSSDESVATVNQNGAVTGVKAGTVTITVSNALGTLAECTVTVK
ncbi:MAG: discoidin domain-containing protein [Lachnospiraceae bacterium]|nr:discoidin domain-containing protein [Lachnospiraceae bacterium]